MVRFFAYQAVPSTNPPHDRKMKGTAVPPETTCRKRGRPKLTSDDAQRGLILEMAEELFSTRGYGKTTTDDVARLCRISKQTLYRLFPGKLALFAAVAEHHRQSMLDLPGDYDHLPIDQALEQIFKIDIDPQADRRRMAFLHAVSVESVQYPELSAALIRHAGDRSQEELARWLQGKSDRGQIVIEDAVMAARVLTDIVFGPILLRELGNFRLPGGPERKKHIRYGISVFLNGVRPRGPIPQKPHSDGEAVPLRIPQGQRS